VQIRANGGQDPAFCGSVNGDASAFLGVHALVRDAAGRLLVGGAFSLVDDQPRASLATYAPSGPRLEIPLAVIGSRLELRWPATEAGFFVEAAPNPAGPWARLPAPPALDGDQRVQTIEPTGQARFFRLARPQ